MRSTRSGFIALTVVVVAAAAALWVVHHPGVAGAQGAGKIWKEADKAAEAAKAPLVISSFADLVKKTSPAVVNVSFEKTISLKFGGRGYDIPFGDDPFHDFFERFFGPMPKEYKNKGLGSGFIINPDGHIITNNHVIEKADKIIVKLKDDDKEYQAKVVGRDSKTDIALVKIDAGKPLPVLPLGDSDKMEVGDWVIAIGNPLGLSHTVTKGIVSFKGRKEVQPGGPGGYYDFIQTDAPINPGNSGGPLLNINGEVIGVNESIVGGAQNIGFAVPANMVKMVIQSLTEHGKVVRSKLGVFVQPVTKDLADSFGLSKVEGALVSMVESDGPADKAGVKAGDIIVEFNGKAVSSSDELRWLASIAGVGTEARVKVIRDGKPKEIKVTLTELLDDGAPSAKQPPAGKGEEIGVTVQPVTPDMARKYGVPAGRGVRVSAVKEDSKAAAAGIQEGDIILKVNDRETNTPGDFVKSVKSVKAGGIVRMLVRRGEGNIFLAFKKD